MTAPFVSTVSPAAANPLGGADAALQTLNQQAARLFDQAAQQVRRLEDVNTPGAAGLARTLGSPAQIGEAIADGLGRYQQRTAEVQTVVAEMHRPTVDPYESATQAILPGPAELHPGAADRGSAQPAADDNSFQHMLGMVNSMFNYGIETQLVVKVGTQFSSTVNTLLKAQ